VSPQQAEPWLCWARLALRPEKVSAQAFPCAIGSSSIWRRDGGAAAEEYLVCGVALGYPDPAAPVNTFFTPREPLENTVRWVE
jgi:nitroreductase